MKTVKFRPLRRVKKTGKITVASYMAWRKVKTSDYSKFELIVNDEYKKFASNEFVYDHNGKQIFFYDYNPWDVPVFDIPPVSLDWIHENHRGNHGIRWSGSTNICYSSPGVDCSGVPTFSHHTASEIAEHHFDRIDKFEALTVGIVAKWFGWFLYQLENSVLQK